MARLFDKNMFIMLSAIMIGAIFITFFIADIVNRSTIDDLETGHKVEIEQMESDNENFTSHFIRATVDLDQARENRANGDYNFKLALLWYQSALSEKNITYFELYKIRGTDNCTDAMPNYNFSRDTFDQAKDNFIEIKSYTKNQKYIEILDIYVRLTSSGSNLSQLNYNATYYLKVLTENLLFDLENGTVIYLENVSDIIVLLDEILIELDEMESDYGNIQDEIDEYEFFITER